MMSNTTREILVDIQTEDGNEKVKTASSPTHDHALPTHDQVSASSHSKNPLKLLHIQESFLQCYRKFKECLHRLHSEAEQPTSAARRLERQAYRKLMEYLEHEAPEERLSSVLKWLAHTVLLIVLITLLVIAWNMGVIKRKALLSVRVHSWIGLITTVISGLPLIRFATYAASESFLWLRRTGKYMLFLAYQLKRSVDFTLYSAFLLWLWFTFFRPQILTDTRGAKALHAPPEEYKLAVKVAVKQITRFLMAISVGAVLWTIKNAVFYVLKAKLHYANHCIRIRDTYLHFHAIELIHNQKDLASTPTDQTKNNKNSIEKGKDVADVDPDMSFWMAVSLIAEESCPIWILKRLTSTCFTRMRTNKPEVLRRLETHRNDDQLLMEEAKNMLEKVTRGRTQPDHETDITPEDLTKYGLKENEKDRVFELFALREGRDPEQKFITQDQFLRWVVVAVKNCLSLEETLKSSERIFWKLNLLMSVCVLSLVFVIWLLLSELVTTAQIAILFAPIVSASFIFGESLRNTFDSIIFVFGMHPFDVGDRVIVDNVEMNVKKMNILTTVFIKYDTGVEAIYPNSNLAQKSIINLDITPDQPDSVKFTLPVDTPEEFIIDLQLRIKKTLDDDPTYTSHTTVANKQISNRDITVVVHFKYLVPCFTVETKASHRSQILALIVKLRKEMENAIQSKKKGPSMPIEIVTFKTNTKLKLPKIDELKNKIMGVLGGYNKSLQDLSHVLFTKINKCEITMDVRMRCPTGLFQLPKDKDKLERLQVEIKSTIEQGGGEVCAAPEPEEQETVD